MNNRQSIRKQIFRFSLPILAQTVVSPLLVLCDTAIIGHLLGTDSLAAMNIGATMNNAIIGIFIFLVYVTNTSVATSFGAGKKAEGVKQGLDSMWLAFALGLILAAGLWLFSPAAVTFFGATDIVAEQAVTYTRAFCVGVPGCFVMLSATGVLRGMKNLKLPMYCAIGTLIVNVPLNLVLLLVFHLGIFGSGLASAIAINLSAVVLVVVVLRAAREFKTTRKPSLSGMVTSAKEGFPIFVRTFFLWMAILVLIHYVSTIGTEAIAGLQILDALWGFAVFAIDSIAQAINTLISDAIGRKDKAAAKLVLSEAVRLALIYAAVTCVIFVAGSQFLPWAYSSDAAVNAFASIALLESAVICFHSAFAFIMDGALIASKDTKFLALSMVAATAIYILAAELITPHVPHNPLGFALILFAYDGVLLGVRALTSGWRRHNDRWLKHAGL